MASKFFEQSSNHLNAYVESSSPGQFLHREVEWQLFQRSVVTLASEVKANNLYPALMIHVALHKLLSMKAEQFDIEVYIKSRADLDWDEELWNRSLKNQLSAAFDSRWLLDCEWSRRFLKNDKILSESLDVLCTGWPWQTVSCDSLEILLLSMTPSHSGKSIPLSDLLKLLDDSKTSKRLNRMVCEYLEGTKSSLLPLDAVLKENVIIYQSGGPYKVQLNCYVVDRQNVVGDGRGLKMEIPLTSSANFREEGVSLETIYRYIEGLEGEEAPEEYIEGTNETAMKSGETSLEEAALKKSVEDKRTLGEEDSDANQSNISAQMPSDLKECKEDTTLAKLAEHRVKKTRACWKYLTIPPGSLVDYEHTIEYMNAGAPKDLPTLHDAYTAEQYIEYHQKMIEYNNRIARTCQSRNWFSEFNSANVNAVIGLTESCIYDGRREAARMIMNILADIRLSDVWDRNKKCSLLLFILSGMLSNSGIRYS